MNRKYQSVCFLSLTVFLCTLSMLTVSMLWSRACSQAAFSQISAFSEYLRKERPDMEETVLTSLKAWQGSAPLPVSETLLTRYGYEAADFPAPAQSHLFLLAFLLCLLTVGAILFLYRHLQRTQTQRVQELTGYLELVNTGASGTILPHEEDAFSHLEDEIYKTVTTLYQTREQAVRAKEHFAANLANIAHQLKTPITAALLKLQLWENTKEPLPAAPIAHQLNRLKQLAEELLLLSRADAGLLQLKKEPVDIYTALTLAAENLEELLLNAGISVEIPEKGSLEITGDLEWTMEAFLNLMKNCMEHAPKGSTIFCDYSRNPLYTEIQIRDLGSGFTDADLPHLFERFYRGKDAKGGGSGIGLYLAHSILELENGTITARNLLEGGACFEIRMYPCH